MSSEFHFVGVMVALLVLAAGVEQIALGFMVILLLVCLVFRLFVMCFLFVFINCCWLLLLLYNNKLVKV